ncbi:metallophosphoesterase [Pedobacter flavus]|uniref:Metallophosphoesterase n=1 Tax=Pedobacter flavus TaxID=3113906 RepID=A0ABU7GZ51_9SPHI|nr:metallophosphoesterase [Pedobacter sp. VNH31]MEE1884102.1 metallophosphoesterase [Pedobacter sp. VNH31]
MGRIYILITASIFLLAFDLYCYKALIGLFRKWTERKKRIFTIIYWSYTILLIIAVFASIFLPLFLTLRAIILVAFFLTVVAKIFMLPFLIVDDLRRGGIKLWRYAKQNKVLAESEPLKNQPNGEPISRSAFLVRAGLVAAAVPLSSLSWGIISSAYDYRINRTKLVLPNLPKSFEGMKIAQISDIHSGSFYNQKAVLGGVDLLLAEKPDMVFFTGDLVNNLAKEMRDYQDIFSKVKAPLGVYSVLGNHDYGEYHFGKQPSAAKAKNLSDIISTHKTMGWNLLMNEHKAITINNEKIGILGIENWGMGRFPKFGKMEEAIAGTEELPVKLLLSHDPSHWRGEVLDKYPTIDAMFSGHTHGMQFGVKTEYFQWSPVQFIYKEWSGLYKENSQQLYVNVGYGFLGYPGRVGILPEITIFELTSA